MEAAVELVLRYPGLLPSQGALGKPLMLATQYYRRRSRWLVQFVPECARYDPDLSYTLRPGGNCRVVNRDHVVEYRANRAGLRDTDAALEKPDIVVLGDSHAMGLSVVTDSTFPEQLERRLGRPVLNAAISSYGTARELTLLERLELPPFRVLVIQYCDNDFGENWAYVERGTLAIMPEERYDSMVETHRRITRYYPFKHVTSLLGEWRGVVQPPAVEAVSVTDAAEARYFLEVLLRHRPLLENKTVIVLELNGHEREDERFIQALRHRLAEPRYAELSESVVPLDASQVLEASDYLVLDGHMRPQGHTKVARLLAEELSLMSR